MIDEWLIEFEDELLVNAPTQYSYEYDEYLASVKTTMFLHDWIHEWWLKPVAGAPDPVAALIALAEWGERTVSPQGMAMGCPLQRLVEELSGVDEGFRSRLQSVYEGWRTGLSRLLADAQVRGLVKRQVDVTAAATFIVAAWQGSIGMAKAYQESEVLGACRRGLESYLQTLR